MGDEEQHTSLYDREGKNRLERVEFGRVAEVEWMSRVAYHYIYIILEHVISHHIIPYNAMRL